MVTGKISIANAPLVTSMPIASASRAWSLPFSAASAKPPAIGRRNVVATGRIRSLISMLTSSCSSVAFSRPVQLP